MSHLSGAGVRTGLENVTFADNSVKTGAVFMLFSLVRYGCPASAEAVCWLCVPFGVASSPIPWPVTIFGNQK